MERGLPSPRLIFGLLLLLISAGNVAAREPLHRQIDRLIESKMEKEAAPAATDGEFLRRVCLDLTGMIPTAAEARAFLDDPSPYKRQKLIDRLMAGPEYARRMQDVFDAMLMERRDDTYVPATEWRAFLRRAFADNLPYDQLVTRDPLGRRDRPQDSRGRQVLPRPAGGSQPVDARRQPDVSRPRPPVCPVPRSPADRRLQAGALLRDLRLPESDDAFWRTRPESTRCAVLAEKADGDVTFSSVFKKKVSHQTGPRILDGPAARGAARSQGGRVPGRSGQGEKGPPDPALQPPRRAGQTADVGGGP